MILLLDHDDSFVFTLARYVAELGEEPDVVRASTTSVEAITARPPARIILSPGPGTPDDCSIAIGVIRALGATVPILGVCLGHQCVAAAYGARMERSLHPRHGRTSIIDHDGRGIFLDVPARFRAARYHSLSVAATTLPPALTLTAVADDGDVMGVRHRVHPVEGVQFHPESVLTEWGHRMLANFLGIAGAGLGMEADQATLCFTPCPPSTPEPLPPSC